MSGFRAKFVPSSLNPPRLGLKISTEMAVVNPLQVLLKAGAACAMLLLVLFTQSAGAEPFVVDQMPDDFDGVVHPWNPARAPRAMDFNGDGQTSWYAGGGQIAHPKEPTPFDPLRYASVALPAISLPVCPSCTPRYLAFAVDDLNRDGHPDIIRLNAWNGHSFEYTLQVFLGNGSNGFTLGWREDWSQNPAFNAGEQYFQIALADFDRDGDPDLALLSTQEYTNYSVSPYRDEGSLSIRWNQNAQFGNQSTVQSRHFDYRSSLNVDDFDQDGDADIFVNFQTTWSEEDTYTFTSRFFANDAGSFTASSDNSFISPIRFHDWNRDSWPDYFFVDNDGNGGSAVRWRSNNRQGGFNGWGELASGITTRFPFASAMADLNEDGIPDLVTAEGPANEQSHLLVLRRGQANGSLHPETTIATLPSNIIQMSSGDARGDADMDLLLRLQDGSFRLVRNQALRLDPQRDASMVAAGISGLSKLAVVDVNRDGVDDLLALQPGGPRLHWVPGTAAGGFAASEFKILASGPSDFAVADFNRDGRPDVAYVVPGAGAVRTVTQIDNIFFSWMDSKIADYAGAALIRAGNANNYNGTTDLLVASNSTGGLRWLTNQGGAVSWNTSDPVDAQEPVPQGLTLAPRYFGFGDAGFTCSADDIALIINGYSNVLGWFRSASLLQVQSVTQTGVCASVDLDDDRELELVFVSGDGRLVSWKPDNSVIVTTSTIAASVPGLVNAIAAVDWNRDGLNDLLVATSQGLFLYAREGLADEWVEHSLYQNGNVGVTDVVAIDFDRDSRPDAAFIHGDAIRLLRNSSRIVAAVSHDYPSGQPLLLQPGQSGLAFEIGVANPGRFAEDASIAVTGTRVVFHKAVANAGSWSMGSAMSKAEVEQAVASVSLLVGGAVVGTTGTGSVAADGGLQINYAAGLGSLVPIQAGYSSQVSLRVNLKPGASSASYSSFYLAHPGTPGLARVLHDGQPVGVSGVFARVVSNRVSFAASHLVGASVLGSGSITPPTQTVEHGSNASFSVTPSPGHLLQSVIGDTCSPVDAGGGSWTALITAPCAVTATFAQEPALGTSLFKSGFEGSP